MSFNAKKAQGEAQKRGLKFPLTNKSLSLAWKSLQFTYDNKHIIVNSSLNVAENHWDPILVIICIQRLSKRTVTLWEQSLIFTRCEGTIGENIVVFATPMKIISLTLVHDLKHCL